MNKNIWYGLRQAALRLALSVLLMSVCRCIFWLANSDILPTPSVSDFFFGLRFDISAAAYANALIFASLFFAPLSWFKNTFFQKILLVAYLFFNFVLIVAEVGDAAYFRYANRRTMPSDFSLFKNVGTGMLSDVVLSHWYFVIYGIILLFFLRYFYQKTSLNIAENTPKTPFLVRIMGVFLGLGLTLIALRGGVQTRPITPIAAAMYASDMRLMPLLSNTSLNFIHATQQSNALEVPNYMPMSAAEQVYPIYHTLPPSAPFRPLNVVVIAMESAGAEMSKLANAKNNDFQGFMPFLDSLATQSFFCENAFANGTRSVQGVAAVTAGIPSLMSDPFIFSAYQANQIEGLATYLRQKNYTTAFFHGAEKGSMDFDKFAAQTGFQTYFAKHDFPDQTLTDGQWGIYDEPMLQFVNEKLSAMPQPFFGFFFSLTAHQPYKVPEFFEKKYPNMGLRERATLYADYALGRFFEAAKKTDWFKNTLFVVTADHTSGSSTLPEYQTLWGRYRIPMLFYKPDEIQPTRLSAATQQIDVVPSVLDFLHFDKPFTAFGRSVFAQNRQDTEGGVSFQFDGNLFQIQDKNNILIFDGQDIKGFFDYKKDPLLHTDLKEKEKDKAENLVQKLKAVVQQHHKVMVHNRFVH